MSAKWEVPAYVPGQFTVYCGGGQTMVTLQPINIGVNTWQVIYSNDLSSAGIGRIRFGTVGGPYKPQREHKLTGEKTSLQRDMQSCVACLPNPEKGCCYRG